MRSKRGNRKCEICEASSSRDLWHFDICPECGATNDKPDMPTVEEMKTVAKFGIAIGVSAATVEAIVLMAIGYLFACVTR